MIAQDLSDRIKLMTSNNVRSCYSAARTLPLSVHPTLGSYVHHSWAQMASSQFNGPERVGHFQHPSCCIGKSCLGDQVSSLILFLGPPYVPCCLPAAARRRASAAHRRAACTRG